jgi:hypothetical protein
MKYRTFDDMQRVADIAQLGNHLGNVRMSRRERLERWAALLLQQPRRPLKPLYRLEFMAAAERVRMRGDDTPLAVAFEDATLREEGLAGDSVGDAMQFFDLSARDVHYLLCDCHYQGNMSASHVAAQIRAIANQVTFRELWNRMCRRVVGAGWA